MIVTKAQLSAKLAGSYPQMRLLATDNTALRLQEGVDGLFPRDAGNPQPFTFFLPASPYSFTATSASPAVFTAVGSSYANGTPVVLTGSSLPGGFTGGFAGAPGGFHLAGVEDAEYEPRR